MIRKVTIDNFRNITHAEYDLGRLNIIKGKNHTGKTNALQAIFWCMTDSLLASNEVDSILPNNDTRLTTSVELVMENGITIRKDYREKWTRNNGSLEETMGGHETIYWINGVKMKKSDAVTEIRNQLITPSVNFVTRKDIDMIKLLTNPDYLFGQVDYKPAREFIISIVGQINDDDVFLAHPELEPIRSDLARVMGKVDVLKKSYTDLSKMAKQEAANAEIRIQLSEDKYAANVVGEEQIENAKKEIELYNQTMSDIRNYKTETAETVAMKAKVAELTEKLNALQEQLLKERQEADKAAMEARKETNEKIRTAQNELADARSKQLANDYRVTSITKQIEAAEKETEFIKKQITELKAEYFEKDAEEMPSQTETRCPHCGFILNGDEINKAAEDWKNRHTAKLYTIVEEGKKRKNELGKKELELENLRKELVDAKQSVAQFSLNVEMQQQKLSDIMSKSSAPITRQHSPLEDEIAKLTEERSGISMKLREEESSAYGGMNQRLEDYRKSMEEKIQQDYQIISMKAIAEDAKKDGDEAKAEKAIKNRTMVEMDEKLATLHEFVKAKLQMVNDSTKKVFPDIEFVLIEDNITTDSYQETCYPLIKGKKTPYIHGSGSERVKTGIAIIEDVKRALGINPGTIIFDEGESLDTETMEHLDTDAQVITSMVCDDYEKPTLFSY